MLSVRLAIAAILIAASVGTAHAQDPASRIVGAWRITGFVRSGISGQAEKVYGEKPVGHWLFTKGGHTIALTVAEHRQKPAGAPMTDAERAHLHRTMYAFSGTYTVVGTKLTVRWEASWNDAWTGGEQTHEITIIGNKLSIITLPFKSMADGYEQVVAATFERVE